MLGLSPKENSPIYLLPSSVLNISSNSLLSPLQLHFIILPSLNSKDTLLKTFPLYGDGQLYVIVPLTLVFTGAVNISPSGKFDSPTQGTTSISLIEKLRSVSFHHLLNLHN